jgi:ABC-type Fe3+/spermidine/putrescine transport system ATPase subunit
MTMSDVIVVMRDGRIQQQGSPVELYERPRNRFVAGFIGQSNSIAGSVASFEAATGTVVVETPAGVSLRGRLADETARPATGDAVVVSIRPERLIIDRTAGDATPDGSPASSTAIAGRIRQGTYLGDQTEYRIETSAGELVARQSHQSGPGATIAPGESVSVRWHDDANVVLVA